MRKIQGKNVQLTKSQLRNLIKEGLQVMLHEQERKMSSDEARDKAISTIQQLSNLVGDDDVTVFLKDVKGWINWTLGERP